MGNDSHNTSMVSFGSSVIGLGALLGAVSLCLRSSLGIVPFFVAANYTSVFVGCFAGAVLTVGVCYLAFSSPKRTQFSSRAAVANLSTVVAIGCSILGAASTFLVLAHPLVAAILFGLLFGVGFACSLEVWLTRFSAFSWGKILVGIALALFLASILWLLSGIMITPMTQCTFCAVVMLFASACLLIRPAASENPSPSDSKDATLSVLNPTLRLLLKQSWAAFALLVFNLFTLGLTFLPTSAGVDHSGLPHKTLAYAIITVIAWFVMGLIARKPSETRRILGILYHISLPIAAAIMLVTPFLDGLMTSAAGDILGTLSYLGIAWGNMMGLAVFTFLIKHRRILAPRLCGMLLVGCALGFCAGAFTFGLLGTGGQVVSLCVLAVYLTALVISELFANASWNKQTDSGNDTGANSLPNASLGGSTDTQGIPAAADSSTAAIQPDAPTPPATQPAIADISDAIAKRYALSSREAEVLHYLARGRSAKYIAEQLYISPETVRTHAKRIYTKTGVHTREELLSLIEHFE